MTDSITRISSTVRQQLLLIDQTTIWRLRYAVVQKKTSVVPPAELLEGRLSAQVDLSEPLEHLYRLMTIRQVSQKVLSRVDRFLVVEVSAVLLTHIHK